MLGLPTRGMLCDLPVRTRGEFPPNVIHFLLHPMYGQGLAEIREFARLYDHLGPNSDETQKQVAPEIHKFSSLARDMRRECICDDAAVGFVPRDSRPLSSLGRHCANGGGELRYFPRLPNVETGRREFAPSMRHNRPRGLVHRGS